LTVYAYLDVPDDFIESAAQGRETDVIELFKSPTEGLGFSVVGLRSANRGDLGIFVQVCIKCTNVKTLNTCILGCYIFLANFDFAVAWAIKRVEIG